LWLAGQRLNPEKADRAINAKNSLKGIFHDPFNSRDRMRLVEPNDGLPIVRRLEMKIQLDLISAIVL
jgi:hypothetical protein